MRNYAIPFGRGRIKRPRGLSQPYAPGQLPAAYGWPTGLLVQPLTIVIGELGGSFYQQDVAAWASTSAMPKPNIRTAVLPGADASPSDADGEVALDWQCAAQAYSWMTGLPADVLIVWGADFAPVIQYANQQPNTGAGSWSWGAPENQLQAADLDAYESAAAVSPFPWTAASGDNDSNDGTNAPVTDWPASSVYTIGCGGTSRPPGGAEVVWNDGNGEGTGGGFSRVRGRPSWQPKNPQSPASFDGRMVPDLACVADPATGYSVLLKGQLGVYGGTSAVAPLMAGFFCAVNGARLHAGLPVLSTQQMLVLLWQNGSSFFDIVNGNNGSYSAQQGPDPCTGQGRPLGTLAAVLVGSSQQPPPPPPPAPPSSALFTVRVPRSIPAGGTLRLSRLPVAVPAGDYMFNHAAPAAARTVEADG